MSRRTHHVLPNGLPLVVTPQPHLHGVCIALAVRLGARDDTRKKWGLSHFLEHMMFRGSRLYQQSAALIAPFERGGGTLNAETWRDHTLFWTVVHPRYVEGAMAALGDMMAYPRFDDIELERLLVQAELDQDIDDDEVDTDIGALSRKNIWGDHPMGRRIVGCAQSVMGFTRQDIRRLHKKAYVSGNMALSVAGRISSSLAHSLAHKHFASLPAGTRDKLAMAPKFGGAAVLNVPQPIRQVSVQWTFEALPDGHPMFAAQSLLVALLDDGMGTRLHRALSEKSGLVYAFQTGLDCYTDCGLFDIDLQVEPSRVPQALMETARVLKDVAAGKVGHKELDGAKQRALIALEMGQDSAEETAQEAAVDLLFGRPSPKDYGRALRRTTTQDIARLAHEMFVKNKRSITFVGATKSLQLGALNQALNGLLCGGCAPQVSVSTARRTRAGQCTEAMPRQ